MEGREMTIETVKVLILIAMFGALEAAMYLPKLRESHRRTAVSRTANRDDFRDVR
jgi:hypothetical protein